MDQQGQSPSISEPDGQEMTAQRPPDLVPLVLPAAPELAAAARSNGMATAGGVLGIAGIILSWIPLAGIAFGLVLGILAIVFSGSGLSRSSQTSPPLGRGMAVTGLVLGIITVAFKLIPGFDLL